MLLVDGGVDSLVRGDESETGTFVEDAISLAAMHACRPYAQAVLHVQGQRFHDPSVINSSIVSALRGEYGDFHLTEKTRGSRLWISPLMPIFWFFGFEAVAQRNLVLGLLDGTQSFREAVIRVAIAAGQMPRRRASTIPI